MTKKFSEVINKFCQSTPDKVDLKCVTMTRELFRSIILKTPVSDREHKGRLVGNWNVKLNGFDFNTSNKFSPERSGPIRRMESIVKKGIFYGDDVWVTMSNGIEYAYRAEYLGWPETEGWSGKVGPYAMVRNGVLEVVTKYR